MKRNLFEPGAMSKSLVALPAARRQHSKKLPERLYRF
jgi:hypothetical protein